MGTIPRPDHPVPAPRPIPAWDNYVKSGHGPKHRPVCALGNYVLLGDTPVCYGEGAEHNERCPEARRLERQRELWLRVYQWSVVLFGLVLLGLLLGVLAGGWR